MVTPYLNEKNTFLNSEIEQQIPEDEYYLNSPTTLIMLYTIS